MVKIKTITNITAIPKPLLNEIKIFLNKYIPQGTVNLPNDVYDDANVWVVVINKKNKVLGFSAQKLIATESLNIIQIMATFLSAELRGRKYASLLLQGGIFLKTWIKSPRKPIYWCTRTRIPAAYAAAYRHNEVFPILGNKEQNIKVGNFAELIAKKVYGKNSELNKETFIMKNSYKAECAYSELILKSNKNNKITQFFLENIDYKENEAIFILSKMRLKSLFQYIACRLSYHISKALLIPLEERKKNNYIVTNITVMNG